ncbi:hypothetical protein EXIGLDRAFT_761092 [Exidia glandulosa HHB12029]|uniref:Uncharacterized protein n=1 Tax=Exidia glandulosa HHB12029 TaxID=1314781 RepID=A0A165NQM3_EXIGL|nr:hypothetical protein EXIGLDRAFT_761092 [Exidia glandulosa HHB12029]
MLVMTALGQLLVARELLGYSRTYLPASKASPTSAWHHCVTIWQRWLRHAFCFMRLLHLEGDTPLGTYAERRIPDREQRDAAAGDRVRTHQWTLVHGFYAAMGGFVFETAPGDPFLPLADTRMVISRAGVKYLMERAPELIPDIAAVDIADRSKAGATGKALLCCQVLYFCGSCVARLRQSLPLSLLEITTIAHSLCALLAYAMWWYKPQDVEQPTLISGEQARQLCALMFMSSNTELYYPLGVGTSHLWPSEIEYLTTSPCSDAEAARDRGTTDHLHPLRFSPHKPFLGFSPKSPEAIYKFLSGYAPPDIKSPYTTSLAPWYLRLAIPWYLPPTRSIDWTLDQRDITRFDLARRALSSYSAPYHPSTSWHERSPLVHIRQQLSQPLARLPRACLCIVPGVLALVYGFPHVLAWWGEFPDAPARITWRMACGAVIITPAISFIVLWIRTRTDLNATQVMILYLCPGLALACPLIYLVASGFLVYESFRQLFALPSAAYLEAHATFYWPHFS